GRYLFTSDIFDAIDRTKPGVGGEIQLTDAIAILLSEQPVYGYVFDEGRFDIGKKIDYLRATVELALDREGLGPEFRAYLAERVRRRGIVCARRDPPGGGRRPRPRRVPPAAAPDRAAGGRRRARPGRRRRGHRGGAALRQHRDGRVRRAGGR